MTGLRLPAILNRMGALAAALDLFYAGDATGLGELLDAQPELVRARIPDRGGHYCGYFHRATLLHHVAGNPFIRPLPAAGPEIAALLLARGAAVDDVTEPGPSQPDDIGWTALGLVATSLEARRAGQQRPLLELLLAHGADLDAQGGGPLIGALYYGELEAARALVERGARVDLIAAAGLGRLDLMARFVGQGGALSPDAHALVNYSQAREPPGSPEEVLALALVYAAMGGAAAAVGWLIDRGAEPGARAPFDHQATALQWAALRGHAKVVSLLLARGADPEARDRTYDSTPRGWAEHAGHTAVAALLPDHISR